MATQDNNPGLLSKVARFVRNPTKDWAELDKLENAPDVDHGKEALKLVIERKRHDDAIRKREFSQLRKLRQASPAAKAELSQGLSTFRSTSGDLDADTDERATTLKKIDEIEAQMSRQWWKGRSGATPLAAAGSASPTPAAPDADVSPGERPEAFPVTQRTQLPSTTQDAPSSQDVASSFDFRPTEPGVAPQSQTFNEYEMSARSVFSPSKMVLIDLGQNLADPELEEAAIRYANGDDAGAEAALHAALALPDARAEMAEGWFEALLDLYRSTGQQASFEHVALAYAQRFGRSAPAWSLSRQPPVASRAMPVQATPVWPVAGARRHWVCPPVLDDVAVAQLRDMVWSGTVTYFMDWRAVQQVSDSAAKSLAELLARWCDTPLSLCFEGVEALAQVLRALTPSSDRSVPKHLWQLRFDVLRLSRLQDDYEMAALDFCVTFEVSPPPWRTPSCQCVCGPQAEATELAAQAAPHLLNDALPSGSVVPGVPETNGPLSLSGEVSGDVSALVAQWQLAEGEGGLWVVSCAQLIRVDFSAAGGLLNWVAHMTAGGKRVEFRHVPRLVAAFFNLIGINEHAQVTVRTN
jgi:ABC-type transporter Mla MlaB component